MGVGTFSRRDGEDVLKPYRMIDPRFEHEVSLSLRVPENPLYREVVES